MIQRDSSPSSSLPKIFSSCGIEDLLVCFVNYLYPNILTKLLLVDILSRIPVRGMEGYPWTVARVDSILKKLREKRCVGENFKPSLEEGHALACFLLQSETGRTIAEHLPSRLRSCKQNISSTDISLTQARVHFYLNNEMAISATNKIFSKELLIPYYMDNPPDDFFKKLKPNLQLLIVEILLNSYFENPLNEMDYKYLKDYINLAEKKSKHITFPFYYLFVECDIKKLEASLIHLHLDERIEKRFILSKEFLSAQSVEDCVKLTQKFKENQKELARHWEDKKYTFPFPVDFVYLFTMMKAYNDVDAKDKIRKDYTAFLKNANLLYKEMELFESAMSPVFTEKMINYIVQAPLEGHKVSPFHALIYFVTLFHLPRAKDRDEWFIESLKVYFDETRENLIFPATAFAQLLTKLLPYPENQEYAEYKALYPMFDFSSIHARELSWEKRMEAIHNFLSGKEIDTKKKISKNPKRLVWFISTTYKEVNPYEQSFSKNDWTKGRRVSVLKLRDDTESYPYLTEQDKEVIKKATKKDYWADTYSIDYTIAMPLLAEHPLVFNEQTGSPMLLELSEPVLEVELLENNTQEEYRLSFSLPSAQAGIAVEEQNGKHIVTAITPSHIKLKEIMGEDNLIIPQKAHEMIFEILSTEESPVKVRTVMELSNLSRDKINSKPLLRLKRTHNKSEVGLEVQAIVYPLEGHSTCFIPTKGSDNFIAKVNNKPYKIQRFIEDERLEADLMLSQCPSLKENLLSEDYHWEFNQVDTAYQTLLELQQTSIELEWFNSEPIRITKSLDKSDLTLKAKAKNNWFSLHGDIQIDENLVLNMRSLLKEMKTHKGRFIPLANGQVVALAEDFKKVLDRVQAITQDDKEDVLLHSLAVPALQNLFNDETIESDEIWKSWQEKLHLLDERIELPKGLQAELRPYQVDGFTWLSSLVKIGAGACLADDMGLGKTLQTITLILSLVQSSKTGTNLDEKGKPILVVAPTSVCHNWEIEIKRFAPQLNVSRITAMNAKKERKSIIENLDENDILIIGYALLNSEMTSLLKHMFKLVVFDEAQALKNPQAIRTKSAHKIIADSKLALTGTPIENSLDDLWSIFNVINTGLLGSLESFNSRFNPSTLAPESVKNNARNSLRSLVKPFILRRTKTAVLDELPPRIEQTLIIEPSEAERALYEALRRQAVDNLEKAKKEGEKSVQFHVLAELTKLRRACCNPVLIDPNTEIESSKLSTLLKLVQDLRTNNHQALIFSQFTSHLEIVFREIENLGLRVFYLDGSTPEKKRGELVKDFQNGKADIFCISLKAGGQGLNLTAADYVIHLDPWWNPAVEDQASDRAHRMGQLRPVTIYRLIMQGSVEEKILKLHSTKRELAEDILSNSSVAHKLSLNDLLQLLE